MRRLKVALALLGPWAGTLKLSVLKNEALCESLSIPKQHELFQQVTPGLGGSAAPRTWACQNPGIRKSQQSSLLQGEPPRQFAVRYQGNTPPHLSACLAMPKYQIETLLPQSIHLLKSPSLRPEEYALVLVFVKPGSEDGF